MTVERNDWYRATRADNLLEQFDAECEAMGLRAGTTLAELLVHVRSRAVLAFLQIQQAAAGRDTLLVDGSTPD